MALFRIPSDYLFGTLSQAAAIGDTSISSASFANLGTGYSTTVVLPVVLHDPSRGVREMVWVTGHTAASTSVTVVRAKEGTTAQAWPSGTQWIVAATVARDGLSPSSAALLTAMTDQHVGMRALEQDTALVKQWTYAAGWQPEVGICRPVDVGTTAAGGSVPNWASMICRVGCVNTASPSSSLIAVTFASPFPNGAIGAFASAGIGTQFIGVLNCESLTLSGMNVRVTQLNGNPPGLASISYLAIGW